MLCIIAYTVQEKTPIIDGMQFTIPDDIVIEGLENNRISDSHPSQPRSENAQEGSDLSYADMTYTWQTFLDMYHDKHDHSTDMRLVRHYFHDEYVKLNKKEYRKAMLHIGHWTPPLMRSNYGDTDHGHEYWKDVSKLFKRYLNYIDDHREYGLKDVYHDLYDSDPRKWTVKHRDATLFDDEKYYKSESHLKENDIPDHYYYEEPDL